MEFRIRVSPGAQRDIEELDRTPQRQVVRGLEKLKYNPRPRGVEKLQENKGFWRLRVGDYRVIYCINSKTGDDETTDIVIARVRHRRDAYRGLGKLDPAKLVATLEPIIKDYVSRPPKT